MATKLRSKSKSSSVVWNKVTPFSKLVAFILIIGLPILAFAYGFNLGKVSGYADKINSFVVVYKLVKASPAK